MNKWNTAELIAAGEEYLWHPFTPTHDCCAPRDAALGQGATGIKIWPEGTLRDVRTWCDPAGSLLVTDEVLTSFGRTGKMFGSEHESVAADIVVLGKAWQEDIFRLLLR
jgi:hypothetical protein